jgi:arylformamidase
MESRNPEHRSVYDASLVIGIGQMEAPPVDGVNQFVREEIFSMEKDGFQLSNLTMNCHSGTHLDSPSHFLKGGKTIDQYPIHRFIVPAVVVEIADEDMIRPRELVDARINEGDALLFKTSNSRRGLPEPGASWWDKWVYLSPEAADFCVDKKISLLGIDNFMPESPSSTLQDTPIHKKLFAHDILVLENIVLRDVPAGEYTLLCLPLRMKGAEASPVRAVLMRRG